MKREIWTGFYGSVRRRARGIDNSEGRQRVLLELYEKFFATALKKDAETTRHRLYTCRSCGLYPTQR